MRANSVRKKKETGRKTIKLLATNLQVIDLLNLSTFKKPLQVRWSRVAGGFYVENLFTVECEVCCTLFFSLFVGKCCITVSRTTTFARWNFSWWQTKLFDVWHFHSGVWRSVGSSWGRNEESSRWQSRVIKLDSLVHIWRKLCRLFMWLRLIAWTTIRAAVTLFSPFTSSPNCRWGLRKKKLKL